MKGSEAQMINFMEGADKRFVIPVYQRKYDWKFDQCHQLFSDLTKVILNQRESHFFGSIVSEIIPTGNKIEYHIIDGQQRLTTVTLLLLAIRNLIKQGKIATSETRLDDQISDRFLLSPWAKPDDQIKLRLGEEDQTDLERLFGPEDDYIRNSHLTLNYQFFCDKLIQEEISIEGSIRDNWETANHQHYFGSRRSGSTDL